MLRHRGDDSLIAFLGRAIPRAVASEAGLRSSTKLTKNFVDAVDAHEAERRWVRSFLACALAVYCFARARVPAFFFFGLAAFASLFA